jgi:hypothetical protein
MAWMHEQEETNRSRQCGDVYVRQSHFTGECVGMTHGGRCRAGRRRDEVFDIHLPSLFVRQGSCN